MLINKFSLRFMVLLLVLLAVGSVPVSAQIQTQPITLGTEATSSVTVTNIAPAFSFAANAAQTINVRVQAVTVGFAPAFRVLDANGLLVQDIGNPTAAGLVEASVTLPQGGTYIVQVQSANGAAGQFTLLVEGGEAPPQPLVIGESIDSQVSLDNPTAKFSFTASPENKLRVLVEAPASDAVFKLISGETELARFSLLLTRGVFDVPPATGDYLVEIEHSGGDQPETFRIVLREIRQEQPEEEQPQEEEQPEEEEPEPTATTEAPPPVVLQPLPSTGPCVVASSTGGRVNVRNQPSTDNTQIIAQMEGNQTATVLGRLDNSSWYRINYNGTDGWISAEVIRRGGDCSAVPVVAPDGSSSAAPTNTPAPSGGDSGGTPDLSVNAISLSPGTPVQDNNFSVNVTISNTGNGTANNVKVRLVINADDMDISVPNSETTISSIGAGTSASYTFNDLKSEDQGDFEIRVRVDPDNSISESNEGNNERDIDVTVSDSRADLVISRLDVDTDDGDTDVIITVGARNDGTEESNDFTVRLRFDPAVIEDQFIDYDDLNPGETTEKDITVDLGTFDDYEVTAEVDYNDQTDEINEDNNERSVDFETEE